LREIRERRVKEIGFPQTKVQAKIAHYRNRDLKYKSEAFRSALARVDDLKFKYQNAEKLVKTATFLPEKLLWEELGRVRAIENEVDRAEILVELVPMIPENLMVDIMRRELELIRIGAFGYRQAGALVHLASNLPEELMQEALETVRVIKGEYRADALVALAVYLPERLLREALQIAGAIEEKGFQVDALEGLAPYLPERLLREALQITEMINSEANQGRALEGLLPYLAKLGYPEDALKLMQVIKPENKRARALTRLASTLPWHLKRTVLERARLIEDEQVRSELLVDLALLDPEQLLLEVLEIVGSIKDEKYQAKVLIELAPFLPEQLLQKVLEMAQVIDDANLRANVLSKLIPLLLRLPPATLYRLWSKTLRFLALRSRHNLLSDLSAIAPIIFSLGGIKAIMEISTAVLEVGYWWP
jgi:hypothetical protein